MSQYKKKPVALRQAAPQAPHQAPAAPAAPRQPPQAAPTGAPRSMEQDRAEFALRKIEAMLQDPSTTAQVEVRRHLHSLPALIRMNGLGQALAFFRSKGVGTGHEHIYRIVSEWLCANTSAGRVFTQDADVLKAITQSDIHHYMAAQNEALALLEWLKKLATALLPKE